MPHRRSPQRKRTGVCFPLYPTVPLGIAGPLAATFVGQAVAWDSPDEAAGSIGSVVGAIILRAEAGRRQV